MKILNIRDLSPGDAAEGLPPVRYCCLHVYSLVTMIEPCGRYNSKNEGIILRMIPNDLFPRIISSSLSMGENYKYADLIPMIMFCLCQKENYSVGSNVII